MIRPLFEVCIQQSGKGFMPFLPALFPVRQNRKPIIILETLYFPTKHQLFLLSTVECYNELKNGKFALDEIKNAYFHK